MPRRVALFGVLLASALLAGCVVVQPKPDGTWSFSLLPPSSPTTVTGGSTGNSAGSKAASASAASALGSLKNPAEPGNTLQSGAWRVLVEGTSSPGHLADGSKASSGRKFLQIDVSMRNAGTGDALLVVPKEFSLTDRSGNRIAPFPTHLSMYNALSVRPIDVAMGGFTSMVYEVAEGDGVYTFTLSPARSGGAPMSWYVP